MKNGMNIQAIESEKVFNDFLALAHRIKQNGTILNKESYLEPLFNFLPPVNVEVFQ